ncbi:MAG: hypothetical protein HZY79_15640 [Rhodoblastus sp.]|nr:MAG: hypothetical protein HZY79_15640 [Rhodoblastus sp.]
MPRSSGRTASAAAIAPLALAIAAALGLGACAAEQAKMFGGLALAVGEAAYTIECKTDLVGRTGATVVAVVQVRDDGAAAKMRATLASNDAFVAQACPLARMVDVIVAGR